jgi:hypothetical protein
MEGRTSVAGAGGSENWITAGVMLALTLLSTFLMLRCASPELFWDEADYAQSATKGWKYLWTHDDYSRHAHGPLSIYLSKLGNDDLPKVVDSPEDRLRFPIALVGSLGIAFVYWACRYVFGTSRAAALVGSSLLLFSVVRLQDTPIMGPHHLMLAFTIVVVTLGYRWRERTDIRTAILFGAIWGGAVTAMTYAIPLAVTWGLAALLAGGAWLRYDRREIRISWSVVVAGAAAGIVAVLLWPPSVLQRSTYHDFKSYLFFPYHATLVGQTMVERTPATAYIYWVTSLEIPILICSLIVAAACLRNRLKERSLGPKHLYLGATCAVMLAAALTAHIAGSRNLLLFLGLLCLTVGAVFDEISKDHPRIVAWAAAVVITLSAANLAWLSWSPSRVPYTATDGYRAFAEQNRDRLSESVSAVVYGTPDLDFYAAQAHVPVNWKIKEMPWSTAAEADLPKDAELPKDPKYILVTELVYRYMPPGQAVRHRLDSGWKVVWSFESKRTWGLRLYEHP